MDEDFLDVTESSKKVWIIFIIVVLLIVVLGYFFIFKKISFGLKTINIEYGEEISTNVEDYLNKKVKNPQDYKLNIDNVNSNEIGTFTYTVTYNNTTKKGKINVQDTTPPKFTLQELVIEEGTEKYFLGDFLESCEDVSKPCLVSLKNEDDIKKFNTVGEHSIDLNITDLYGNSSEGKGTLKVVAKGTYVNPKTQDLEVYSNSREDENFKGTIYEKLDSAVPESSDEADDIMSEISAMDIEAYINVNYPGYRLVSSEIIELYNKSKYVVGYSIEIIMTNGTEKTIYAEKSKVPATQNNIDNEE